MGSTSDTMPGNNAGGKTGGTTAQNAAQKKCQGAGCHFSFTPVTLDRIGGQGFNGYGSLCRACLMKGWLAFKTEATAIAKKVRDCGAEHPGDEAKINPGVSMVKGREVLNILGGSTNPVMLAQAVAEYGKATLKSQRGQRELSMSCFGDYVIRDRTGPINVHFSYSGARR